MKYFDIRIVCAIFFVMLGMSLSPQAFAQALTVNGHVYDSSGEVIGASVVEKGNATNGTVTDINGNFTLKVKKNSVLVISCIGYKTQEVASAANVNVRLTDNTELLDEVIVIGYGSVKKKDLSGSVIAIKAEDTNRGAVTSPQELLQGKVPGLFVAPGDGAPGAGSTIRIRGGASLNASNDPLIVIDGVPTSNNAAPGTPNALATINPNDIETFTVLKDASATAIYGSRASNGVIIITTKKGTQDRVRVSYAGTFSVKDPYKRMENMTADEFRQTIAGQYPAGTTLGDAAAALLNQYPDQSTDWQDEIFQTGLATDHNLSVSGKAGFLPFRVSFGYNKERGTLKTSDYERFTGSINLSPKFFNDHLSVDANVKGTINNNRFADSGAVGAAAFFDPTKPVRWDSDLCNGYWSWGTVSGDDFLHHNLTSINPVAMLMEVDNHGNTKRSLGNLQLDYKIHGLEDLRANLNLGYDFAKSEGRNFVNPGSPQSTKDSDFKNIGRGKTWWNLRRNHLLDFYLDYAKEFEKIQSSLDVMVGYSWQHFYYSDHTIEYSNKMQPIEGGRKGWTYSDADGAYIKNGHHATPKENFLVSFFGRLNYSFKDRYLLTATLRRDGSSRFSANNRWGLFPSAALAWSLSEESWMAGTKDVLSNLKLRLGYGVTGQQEIQDYMFLPTYVMGSDSRYQYFNSFFLKPNGYSPDLKWEQTATYNIGIDFGFLNNRINGSIEFYRKDTKDLLSEVSAPAGTNFANIITANVGEMENKGVELNLNATVIKTKDFSWDVNYNVTWNDSKITKLTAKYNPEYPGLDAGWSSIGFFNIVAKHQVGHLPQTYWLYQQVYDTDGNPIQNAVVDRNKDGEITEADKYLTDKSPMAKVFMGFSSQFRYKNWDLGFNLRANLGNYVFNEFAAGNTSLNTFSNQGYLINYYKDAGKYGFTEMSTVHQSSSDLYLENASFLKMDNITIGYSFDKFFTEKISGRVSASVQNVFTITKYTGADPECDAVDGNIWPRPRTFTLGLNLNF